MGSFDLSPATHDVTIGDTKLSTVPYTLELREELADLRGRRDDLRNELIRLSTRANDKATDPDDVTKLLEQIDDVSRKAEDVVVELAVQLIVDADGKPIDEKVLGRVSMNALGRLVAAVLGDAEEDPTEPGQAKT